MEINNMKKVRKVFKYATGEAIPKGAIYLSTLVEKEIYYSHDDKVLRQSEERNALVWHYFLVEVKVNKNEVDL